MAAEAIVDQATSPQPVAKWAPIAGRWTWSKTKANYLESGVVPAPGVAPFGVLLAGPRLRNGQLGTNVRLSSLDNAEAGFVLGFQSTNSHYLAATLGGFGKAYAIHEYRPDSGPRLLASAGHPGNLDLDRPIRLTVQVAGQTLRLQVDEVDVLSHVLTSPFDGTGCGLWVHGNAPTEFTDTTLVSSPPKLFVMMPFAEPFDTLYREVIREVAARAGFEVVRVDEVNGPGLILDDIQQQIEESNAVVAEVSSHNANVFYELGYAHALRKPAILLVRRQDGDKMPFDIRGFRAIFYDDSIGGKRTVERALGQHLQAIQRDRIA